jgi:hypothetical protein
MLRKPFSDITNIPLRHRFEHLSTSDSDSESETSVSDSDSNSESESEVDSPATTTTPADNIPESSSRKRNFSEMDSFVPEIQAQILEAAIPEAASPEEMDWSFLCELVASVDLSDL